MDLCGWPISRVLSTPDRDPGLDDHSSARTVASGVKLPTRASGLKHPCGIPREAPIRHCSGWGLPYRPGCPVRGGLLPHRFTITVAWRLGRTRNTTAVSSLWRFPSGCPGRALPGTLSLWSPDFPRSVATPRSSSHPHEGGIRPMPPLRQRLTTWPNRSAKSAISPASSASSGPLAHGRNRNRNAASTRSAPTSR